MIKLLKSLAGIFILIFIMFLAFFQVSSHNFNEKVFNPDNVYKNSKIIASIKDNSGQVKFIENYFKSIGISPAGENKTYYQSFKTMSLKSDELEETPNILGMIDGKNKAAGYLIISSHIDGDAEEAAYLLELARDMKLQKYKPEKTVIFAVWNSFEQGMKGSKYYADNPIFPLDKSCVIVIDSIGKDTCKNLYMMTYGAAGKALMGQLSSYSNSNGISTAANENIYENDNEAFSLKDVPAVLIQADTKGSFWDNKKGAAVEDGITAVGTVLLNYIHRDIYKDMFNGLFSNKEKIFMSVLILVMLLIYLLKQFYKLKPSGRLFKINIESIYYSSMFIISDKLTTLLLTVILSLFLILFIVYIPSSFDIVKYNGYYMSNYPIYIILQNAHSYIRDFAAAGFGKTMQGFSVWPIIVTYTFKSMILVLCSILLAFIIGSITGTVSGFKHRKSGSIRFISSIAFLSMPDVLVAILLQVLLAFLYKHIPKFIEINKINQFVFPLISLTFIPAAYISRIAQVAVREEINKDYIIAAKAKGLSDFSILKNHLLISVVIKVVEALPSVLTIIISNLIIVEYFFAYLGVVYQLFHYFKDGDIKTCIGLIIGIGIVYLILTLIFKLASILINPFKRRNIIGGYRNEKA